MTTQHVLILGSGAAGAAAARTLATRDDVRVTMVTRTGETPYTRMLIKGIAFGPTPPEMIKLPLPQIEVIADTVLDVDTTAKRVQLTSGAQVSYDALIVATGSVPRSLPRVYSKATTSDKAGSLLCTPWKMPWVSAIC